MIKPARRTWDFAGVVLANAEANTGVWHRDTAKTRMLARERLPLRGPGLSRPRVCSTDLGGGGRAGGL